MQLRKRSKAQCYRAGIRSRRSGAATVELAVCLPVILTLVLGTIEVCTMVFLKQSLTIAAYEGARVAISQNATNDRVLAACNQILTDRKVRNARIRLTPSDISSAAEGSYIVVRIRAACNANSVIRGGFFSGKRMQGRVSMMKEFD